MQEYERFRLAAAHVRAAHPEVLLTLTWSRPDEPITMQILRTPPGRHGAGLVEEALRDVIALADRLGYGLRVVVEPIGGSDASIGALTDRYGSHGFVLVGAVGGRPVMQRPAGG
ncbi:hypothetical protein [Actinomadura nitritigenes]|uniref:hypothetical protein n=1 Tax=Actinomadura nitritigenes TaxID=134602 RepID=UPI003D94C2A3